MMFIRYLFLQIKRAIGEIPYMIAGTLILAAWIAAAVFCGSKLLYQEDQSPKLQVGGVLLKEDKFGAMAAAMLESMDSVQSFCEVHYYYDSKEAKQQLRQGKLDVLIELHEGYYEEIMKGMNHPIMIYLSDRAADKVALFRMMSDTGSMILTSAQISSSAVGTFCREHGFEDELKECMFAMNNENMKMFFKRDALFQIEHTKATGELSTLEYYILSGIAMFFLFLGIPAGNYLSERNVELEQNLKREGIGTVKLLFAKMTAAITLYGCIAAMMLVPVLTGAKIAGFTEFHMHGKALPSVLIALLLSVCYVMILYEITEHYLAGTVLVFLASFAGMYLSGGLVPLSFLPEAATGVYNYLPSTALLNLLAPLAGGTIRFAEMGKGIAWCLFLFFAMVLLRGSKERVLLSFGRSSKKKTNPHSERKGQNRAGAIKEDITKSRPKSDRRKNKLLRGNLLLWGKLCMKRYVQKPAFWLSFLALLLLAAAFVQMEKDEDKTIDVAVYMEQKDGECEKQLLAALQEEQERLHFYVCDSREVLERDVNGMRAKCGIVMEKGMENKMLNNDYTDMFLLYASPSATHVALTKEVVYAAFAKCFGSRWTADKVIEMLGSKAGEKGQVLAEIEETYQILDNEGPSFHFQYEDMKGESLELDEEIHSTFPMRGMCAIYLMVVAVMAVTGMAADKDNQVYMVFGRREGYLAGLIQIMVPTLLMGIAAFFSMAIAGQVALTRKECCHLLAYIFLLCLVSGLLYRFLGNVKVLAALLPLLVLGSLVFCPVFIDIQALMPSLAFMRYLFLPYYYLL